MNKSVGYLNFYSDSLGRVRVGSYPKDTYLAAKNSRCENPVSTYIGTYEVFMDQEPRPDDTETNYWKGYRKGQHKGFLKGVVFAVCFIALFFASMAVWTTLDKWANKVCALYGGGVIIDY